MLVLIFIRGLAGLYSEVYRYTIPVDIEQRLRIKATELLLNAEVKYTDNLPIEKVANYCVEFPARVGIAVRFAAMFGGVTIVPFFKASLSHSSLRWKMLQTRIRMPSSPKEMPS